jgi:predicted GNAT superfamily acetyltransferase
LTVETRRVRGKLGPVDFEVVTGAEPAADAEALLIQIPVDFYRVLQETEVEDPEVRRIPVDWRLHTRSSFLDLFERGYRVVDFLKSGPDRPGDFYVLQK